MLGSAAALRRAALTLQRCSAYCLAYPTYMRPQVVTARTRVENGMVFELTLKLGQGDQRVQLFRVRPR